MPLSRAYDVTWAAMEKLVEKGKAKLIGERQRLNNDNLHAKKGP